MQNGGFVNKIQGAAKCGENSSSRFRESGILYAVIPDFYFSPHP